jgi:aromatic-L-amino-acid decarboxylase
MRRMPKLDPTSDEFRAAGHKLIDWISDYLDGVDRYDVLSRVQPGDIEKQFAGEPSVDGRSYDVLLAEVDSKIIPGITHWNHPAFFAYFSITGSQAGILAELLTAALNVNGMVWRTSPSLTELETVTLRWLRDALGLPSDLFGIINDTASINSFLALAAAREKSAPDIRTRGFSAAPALRVYCSEHAHSSIEKGALALGFGIDGVIKIPGDDSLAMSVDALEAAIARDRKSGPPSARPHRPPSIRYGVSRKSPGAKTPGCTSIPRTPARPRSVRSSGGCGTAWKELTPSS